MTRRILVVGVGPGAEAIAAALGEGGAIDVAVAPAPGSAAAPVAAAMSAAVVDLVIEAALDLPLPAKVDALAALLASLPGSVPIAVATRRHELHALLPATRHGSRVVGFNLLPGSAVAELAMPVAFDDTVVDAVLDLLAEAGIIALPCMDAPGRIVDRLVVAVALEARALVQGGAATQVTADAALRAAGLSLAAFADTDLDAIAAVIHAGLGDAPRFASGSSTHPAAEASPGGHLPIDAAAVADRLSWAAIAEAYRLVGDAIAGADEIERAMTLGAGWATGPFTLAGRLGLRVVVTGLAALSRAPDVDPVTADRFAIPALLWQMATV